MKCIEEHRRYELELVKSNQDVIEISNGISAGNNIRSSLVAMELIKLCGYDIDEEYIRTHKEFMLEDKYDANNLKFDDNVISEKVSNRIKINIAKLEKPYSESQKINKLHYFISNNKAFNTCGTHIDFFHTGKMKLDNLIYYVISSLDKEESNKIYSYLFVQENENVSNLKIKYIGRIDYGEFFA
jgi:hypothetical protein